MFWKRFMSGMLSSNCYILGDSGEAVVIDPGVGMESIRKVLGEQELSLKYIILTHAHIDHILSMQELCTALGGRIAIHELDAPLLADPAMNGSVLFGLRRVFGWPDLTLKDGDILEFGDEKLEILHTPGHTPGSICIRNGNNLYSGDTLFRLGIGRTDLGAGDGELLMKSLKRLLKLGDGIKVYPGHGSATEIGFERGNNTYIW